MIKTTTWSPDTCDCTLVYSWDTEAPENTRVHTPVSGQTCAAHQAHAADVATLHATVLSENKGKNKAYDEACIAVPRLLPEHFTYSFDAQRKLILTIKSLTPTELLKVKAVTALKNINIAAAKE